MLKQAKNAVGSNTPGAASSAADLEAENPPKSRPKPKKIDVKKLDDFGIVFFMAGTSFWKVFGEVFGSRSVVQASKAILGKSLQNTGHGDKIKGRRFRNLRENLKKTFKILFFLEPRFWKPFLSIPCAAHRPPHQKERKRSSRKRKRVATACIKSIT